MSPGLPFARSVLYPLFFIVAFVTFALAAGLTGKSISDYNVYSPPVIALLTIVLLSLFVIMPLHFIFHRRPSTSGIASVWVELLVLSIFCVGYIGAAGAMAASLGIGYYCHLVEVDYYTGYYYNVNDGECGIVEGLDFMTWFAAAVLLDLIIVIFRSSVQQQKKGNKNVWTEQFGLTPTTPNTTPVVPNHEVYQEDGPQVYYPIPLQSETLFDIPARNGQFPRGHGSYQESVGTGSYGRHSNV